MKRLISKIALSLSLAGIIFITGCKKNDPYDLITPGEFVHFVGPALQNYTMTSTPAPVYKINIGTTDVSASARTATINVTSNTGAVAGTHYSIVGGNTITIPAGQATASFDVQGVYAQYTAGRKDTLKFSFTQPGITKATFLDTVKLLLRGPCFEGDAVLTAFAGVWNNTNELFGTSAYGPYRTTITNITPLTATTGRITVTNIWDFGWGPIDFILDWTNPAARTVTVVPATSGIADAGTINPAYAGQQVAVRPFAGQPGTFSFCNGSIVLRMQLGVAGLGYFGSLYTVTPGR